MFKFSSLALGSLLAVTLLFSAGCQKVEEGKSFSESELSALAQKHFDENVSPEEYNLITNSVASLSEDDYELYLNYWVEAGVDDLVKKKIISPSEKSLFISKEIVGRKKYNEKAKELYGSFMNKLSLEQQENVVNSVKDLDTGSGEKISVASCPAYYYPTPVTRDQTGTYSCVAVYSVSNPATTDCDWEFAYNMGNVIVYSKVKTNSVSSYTIFLAGGINYRRPSAPENVAHRRFLVGKGKINSLYIGYSSSYAAAQQFGADVKFRGLA